MTSYYYVIADCLVPLYGHKYFVTYNELAYPITRHSTTVIKLSNGVREIVKSRNFLTCVTEQEFTLIILKSIHYVAE